MLYGMILAFSASIFWTFSPVFFAAAGRKIGPYKVNLLRLVMAALLFCVIGFVYNLFSGGAFLLPVPWRASLYLVLSGLFGLVIGDMFYLQALITLGPRRTTQFLTLAPIVPVVVAWVVLGEKLSWNILLGIGLIIGGIAYIVFHEQSLIQEKTAEPGKFTTKGFILTIVGVLFHSSGAVMARWAFIEAPDCDPIAATAVRVVSSGIIMLLFAIFRNNVLGAIKDLGTPGVPSRLTGGVLAGPVIGMVFYIAAFKYAYAGVVTTLSGLSPVLILPIVAIRYRVKIRIEAIIGAAVTVAGASIMGLGG
jgi:drug/metabolite transporter (DMT)-like permease